MANAAPGRNFEEPIMNCHDPSKKNLKRTRDNSAIQDMSPEERESRIRALKQEIEGLFGYYRELMSRRENLSWELDSCSSLNTMAVLLMEGREVPWSKLVDEIYVKVKEKVENVTLAAVKKALHSVGQRVMYGMHKPDADVFEDDTQSCLWCWEARDLKSIPKSMRGTLKIRRTCRKMIHERITAVSTMIAALENHHINKYEILKASEKVGKVLSEEDIRIYMDKMLQKNEADIAEKEVKLREKMLIKRLERDKREAEKEKKKIEREKERATLIQKRHNEKEQKRLQEIEKEEKRREESEMRKHLRKQQDEANKEQRRQEKEQAELKKQLEIQKQALILERFLKQSKMTSSGQNEHLSKPTDLSSQDKKREAAAEAVTLSMDCALSSGNVTSINDIRKSHLAAWCILGNAIRCKSNQHWGRRRKPKIEIFRELKLSSNSGITQDDELIGDKCGEKHSDAMSCMIYSDRSVSNIKFRRKKQLLQFDKCYRPAFYGVWPKRSQVVGPRQPFKKDPDLDYDVDSDEEWEEEEPGESLSDCDKDEEEILDDRCSKVDEEDESEDGFFVPDGYLSDDEGVQLDRKEAGSSPAASGSSANCKAELEPEEFGHLLRHQRHLHSLTEQALRKNQPLIITNLMHEKILVAEDLCGNSKLEQACLQALSIRLFPGSHGAKVSVSDILDEDQEVCTPDGKGSTQPLSMVKTMKDADLLVTVSVIQSCQQGINKVVEALQEKFPAMSKNQLRNTVREISDFKDNRWQVKRDVQLKLGFSSPDKSLARPKSITSFFSKRCLPPSCKTPESIRTSESSPKKAKTTLQQSPVRSDNI